MSDEKAASSRRDFLKLATVAAPAAAAAAVVPGAAEAAPEDSGDGYRKTEHVEKYLDSARF